MRVLICGGGVIGASIAYFLSRRGIRATVVERTGLACAASGKAGGFLASEWCDGTPLGPLARRSFALHAELAETMAGDWGYRRLDTYGGIAGRRNRFGRRGESYDLSWLSANAVVTQQLGTPETTAQVHPARFTQAMMQAAQERGAQLRIGIVEGVLQRDDRAAGIIVDGEIIEGDAVVIAMGPWSILAAAWLPLPAIFGLKGHSLVFDTGTSVPAEALFCEYREATGAIQSPELFPRTRRHYLCLRNFERNAVAARPVGRYSGPGCYRAARGDLPRFVAVIEPGQDHCAPSLLSTDFGRRVACHRPGARCRRRLCCDRA